MDVGKLWFLVLTLLTAIFVGLTIAHTIYYQSYIVETTKHFLDRGFDYEFIEGYVDFHPWHMYGMGQRITLLGLVTGFLWFVSLIVRASVDRSETLEREA